MPQLNKRKQKKRVVGKVLTETHKDLVLKYFLEHIRAQRKYEKYQHGTKFIKNFQTSLYKGKEHSFLVSLTKSFLENPVAVSLSTNIEKRQTPIFSANIRFTKDKVIVETLQGTPWLKEMREFERIVGIPSSRYLIHEIIGQAKKMGFDKVLLIDPTKHGSYRSTYIQSIFDEETKALHTKVAFKTATITEKKRYIEKRKEFLRIHQERMRKLYENVAKGEGFEKEGKYFVKQLK